MIRSLKLSDLKPGTELRYVGLTDSWYAVFHGIRFVPVNRASARSLLRRGKLTLTPGGISYLTYLVEA